MSRRKGMSPVSVALLIIPVVLGIGAYAYTAGQPLVNGVTPCPDCSEHWAGEDMHEWMMHRHGHLVQNRHAGECGVCDNDSIVKETVVVDGTVLAVSADERVITVEGSDGEVYEFKVGGRWVSGENEWVPYYYLLENVSVGDSVHVEGYIGCDGDLRATSITVDGLTYVWLTGGHE